MTEDVLFENRGAISLITFNILPNGKGMSAHVTKAIHERCRALAANRAIRAVLLQGQREHFIPGHEMDIYGGGMNALQDQVYQKVQFFNGIVREIHLMEKPVIAALRGKVHGEGFNLMLASDLVIAARGTIFNADYVARALVPDGGATFFLPRKVGLSRANEILLVGEDFSAEKAAEWGLVNSVVEDDELESTALALAQKLAAGATRMLGATKALLGKSFEQNLPAQISQESAAWTAASKTYDFLEAVKASVAKRPVKYTGA